MVNNRVPSVFSKTYVTPRRPFEKARLDQELKIIGEYGLRNKREVWRVKYTLARIRKAARELLTLEEKEPKRLFEGESLWFTFVISTVSTCLYRRRCFGTWNVSASTYQPMLFTKRINVVEKVVAIEIFVT